MNRVIFPSSNKNPNFKYFDSDTGKEILSEAVLTRIRKLAIPPNWSHVQINKDPTAYLQVTGKDSKNRTQYIYHPLWITLTSVNKYFRMFQFAKRIKLLQKAMEKDLVSVTKVHFETALMLYIMERTFIRVGNEVYERKYNTFGLTTLQKTHVQIRNRTFQMTFVGKKGVKQNLACALQEHMIKYIQSRINTVKQDESIFVKKSNDVNEYIKKHMGYDFSCKDFRTYASNILFIKFLKQQPIANTKKMTKKTLRESYEKVAQKLGHTKEISKKSYVMPRIEEKYLEDPKYFQKYSASQLLEKFIL